MGDDDAVGRICHVSTLTARLPELTASHLRSAHFLATRKASSSPQQHSVARMKTCIFRPLRAYSYWCIEKYIRELGQFTLSIPSARQYRNSLPRSRQVLKKDFLAVWLCHFHSYSVYIPVQCDTIIYLDSSRCKIVKK